MSRLVILHDVQGRNRKGELCHPYMGSRGASAGLFSVSTSGASNQYQRVDERTLREMIEAGKFDAGGRIRMVPDGDTRTRRGGGMRPLSYKGRELRSSLR